MSVGQEDDQPDSGRHRESDRDSRHCNATIPNGQRDGGEGQVDREIDTVVDAAECLQDDTEREPERRSGRGLLVQCQQRREAEGQEGRP